MFGRMGLDVCGSIGGMLLRVSIQTRVPTHKAYACSLEGFPGRLGLHVLKGPEGTCDLFGWSCLFGTLHETC